MYAWMCEKMCENRTSRETTVSLVISWGRPARFTSWAAGPNSMQLNDKNKKYYHNCDNYQLTRSNHIAELAGGSSGLGDHDAGL